MKIAILFPGIGYHCDKPLLYHSGKLCTQYQYETVKLTYTNLSRSIPEAFAQAYAQTEASLEKLIGTNMKRSFLSPKVLERQSLQLMPKSRYCLPKYLLYTTRTNI